jgi:hypothetical protein
MKFERYSDKVLQNILEDLEIVYAVLQKSFEAKDNIIDRFEGILSSDFGANLRKLRDNNPDLTEKFRLKAVKEVDSLIEQVESEQINRTSNRN